MISSLKPLEANLDDLFVKKAPPLPLGGKKTLVQYLPWINFVLGVLTLYDAWVLWHWAHYTNALISYANSVNLAYGGDPITDHRMGLGIWLGVAVLLAEGLLYFAAFPRTRDCEKSGWDYMFYAALLNVLYGVVILFSDYGSLGGLIGAVIGSGIGLYLLYQIRVSYLKPVKTEKTVVSSD